MPLGLCMTHLVIWTAKGQAKAAKEPPAMVENTALGNTQSGTGSGMPMPREQGPSSSVLPTPCSQEAIEQGLIVGMSPEEVISILGAPNRTTNDGWLTFFYDSRAVDPYTKKIGRITVTFKDKKYHHVNFY